MSCKKLTKVDCIVSVVLYQNSPEMVRTVVKNFLDCKLNIKIYLIDNSPNSSLGNVICDFNVKYLSSSKNIGFGKGHNLVINKSEDSDYYLILNPDIVIPHGVLEELICFMNKNKDIGVVSPKFLNEDGSIQYLNTRMPSVSILFLRRFLPKRLKPFFQKRLDFYEMMDMGYDTIYDVPCLSGAFMLFRTTVLKKIGGFDSRFFLYFEDNDLSLKASSMGYRTVFYPYVSVIHKWERAAHNNIKMALVFICSGIKFFNKWGWRFF